VSVATGVVGGGCCGAAPQGDRETVHNGLAGLLQRYDVNDYAASVKVFGLKRVR
jgi:hypothetical protein